LVNALVFTFTGPTYQRVSTLLVGAVLTTGRRHIANLPAPFDTWLRGTAPITSGCSPARRGPDSRSGAP